MFSKNLAILTLALATTITTTHTMALFRIFSSQKNIQPIPLHKTTRPPVIKKSDNLPFIKKAKQEKEEKFLRMRTLLNNFNAKIIGPQPSPELRKRICIKKDNYEKIEPVFLRCFKDAFFPDEP